MRVPKWTWLLFAVIVIASGAVLYAATNLGSYLNANREKIAERVSETLGRPVRFSQLELSIGRGLGIAVHELGIGEDPDFGKGDFLTARRAFVQVRVLPALFGRYEVARVSLESPAISVVRSGRGTSFETLGTSAEKNGEVSTAERRAVAIALVDIEDASVRYVDLTQKPQREFAVTKLDFQASDLSFGDSLRFELSAAALGAAEHNVSASGAVGPFDPVAVSATPLDVIVQLEGVDSAALQALLPAVPELRISGPITAKIELGGTLAAWTLNFVVNSGRTRVTYGGVFEKPDGLEMKISGHVERRADAVVADGIEITARSSTLSFDGNVIPGQAATAYAFTLNGTSVSLTDLAALSPALGNTGLKGQLDIALEIAKTETSDRPTIEGRIGLDGLSGRLDEQTAEISQLSGVMTFEGTSATLPPADLRVGGESARFGARIENLFAPVVVFDLSAPKLPLALLMEDAGDDALSEVACSGRLSLTAEAPELEGEVRAAGASVRGLTMKNLQAKILHAQGATRLDPLTFDTCGGGVRGSLRRSTAEHGASGSPRMEVSVSAARLSMTDLAAGLTGAGANAPASGNLSFQLAAMGTGNDWPSLRTALDGKGSVDITDGAILGTNIPEATLERITGLPGLSALLPPGLREDFPALFGAQDTRFDSLRTSFVIANGRLQTEDLAVRAEDFAIDGGGTLGLGGDVDISATLTTSTTLSNRLAGEVAAVKLLANRQGGIDIPFRLTGTLPDIKPQPDTSALAKRLQHGLVGAIGERLLGGGPKKEPSPRPSP